MRSGTLRHRVQIQAPPTALGTRGERTGDWTLLATVWAEIETLGGNELLTARAVAATATHRIRLRGGSHLDTLTRKHRIVFGGRTLYVGHLERTEQREAEIVLLCGEEER